MTRNIWGYLFIGLAVVSVGLGIKAWNDQPAITESLKQAVYLDKPVVSPQNEGKLIIVKGRVTTTQKVYDKRFKLELDTPYAARFGAVSRRVKKDGKMIVEWDSVNGLQEDFHGQAVLGQFVLSRDLIESIPSKTDYQNFDEEVLRQNNLYGSEDSGQYWLYNDHYVTPSGKVRQIRIRYNYKPSNTDMTIVGTQQGNTIIAGDSLHFVREGIMTKEAIVKEQESFTPVALGCGIATIFFLGLGIRKLKR